MGVVHANGVRALPGNRVASAIAFHIIKLYEGDHYVSYVKSDLGALLKSAGVEPSDVCPSLRGLARITIGRRREPDVRARSDGTEESAAQTSRRAALSGVDGEHPSDTEATS